MHSLSGVIKGVIFLDRNEFMQKAEEMRDKYIEEGDFSKLDEISKLSSILLCLRTEDAISLMQTFMTPQNMENIMKNGVKPIV